MSGPSATDARVAGLLGGKAPLLLPLRLEEAGPDRILGACRFEGDEPWFAGHFPGDPLVPGIVLLEALVQAAARAEEGAEGETLMVLSLDRVRFRRPVRPGDTLRVELKLRSSSGPMRVYSGRGEVLGEEAVSARLRLSLAPSGVRR